MMVLTFWIEKYLPSFSKISWEIASAVYKNLDTVNYPEDDHRRIRGYGLRCSRLPMNLFRQICEGLDRNIMLLGPRSALLSEAAVHAYVSPAWRPFIHRF